MVLRFSSPLGSSGSRQSNTSTASNLTILLSLLALIVPATAVASGGTYKEATYTFGDEVPVTCLNRTLETGEHVEINGVLQYVPFLTCKETSKPLALKYLSEDPLNCTIASFSDETYHLWEFYVHHDSPLACRVPARPFTGDRSLNVEPGAETNDYIPFVINLAGKLEKSHLHISTVLNVIFHTSEQSAGSEEAPGTIDSATAYSISPLTSSTRIIIGDPLPLRFFIRWYAGTSLPASDDAENDWGKNRSNGGHITAHLLIYCLMTAGCTAVACTAWFLGWEFPRRLRRVRAGGALGGFPSLGINGGGGVNGLSGISVGPGKAGGYGILPTESAESVRGAGGWYTKKD